MRTFFLLIVLAVLGSLSGVFIQRGAVLPSFSMASFAATPAFAPTPARMVVVGIDLSSSNPMIRDDAFAAKVAARIRPMISSLPPRSRVILRSFGSYNSQANAPLTLDIQIAPKTARAEDIATLIANVVAGVPKMVRQGRIEEQGSSNIVPFLNNIAGVVDCRTMQTSVVLASDGVEDSQVTDLTRRRNTLPAPQVAPFPGCEELVILGIGRGLNSPADTQRLHGEWAFWAQSAGFQRFTGLNDW
ncbi:MAG: hypothetical protein ABL996_00260 [Micropepsaceae bacterium]